MGGIMTKVAGIQEKVQKISPVANLKRKTERQLQRTILGPEDERDPMTEMLGVTSSNAADFLTKPSAQQRKFNKQQEDYRKQGKSLLTS